VRAVLLCPGQGAQRVGMGKDLAERFPAARAVFAEADAALGTALSRLMWEGPEPELTLTHNAQPAILVHTLAVHAVVGERLAPVAAAGHSLGEYAAYAALGALTLADAVRLVRTRGELMLAAGRRVSAICAAASREGEVAVAANLNAPDQVVISGDPPAIERAGAALKEAGAKRVLPLKVSGAFHSPLMAPAAAGLAAALDRVTLRDPRAPVVANASAEPVRDAATARRLLAAQLTAPVRWAESVQTLMELGGGAPFLELGPGNVLAGLARRSAPDVQVGNLGTAVEVEVFMEKGLA
jgi:[acyl-carrier-protein] S-malonyltransferase